MMKLFVKCHNCEHKIQIEDIARERNELPRNFIVQCNNCGSDNITEHAPMNVYTPLEVFAEPEESFTTSIGTAIVLGTLGLATASIAGLVVGGAAGHQIGQILQKQSDESAEQFNKSQPNGKTDRECIKCTP